MKIHKIQEEIHKTAVDHGWWSDEPNIPEKLMLIVSEASEALEHYRSGQDLDEVFWAWHEQQDKPDGFPIELADIIIRVLDLAEYLNIDMTEAIRIKVDFNKTRTFRHGNKKA